MQDIQRKTAKIGDKVAFAVGEGTHGALRIGTVWEFYETARPSWMRDGRPMPWMKVTYTLRGVERTFRMSAHDFKNKAVVLS